jgi:hypothetical protein
MTTETEIALLAEIRAIRASLERQQQPAPGSDLLAILAAAVGCKAFSAAEAFEHGVLVNQPLSAALEAERIRNPRMLGKRLKRHEGAVVGDAQLRRIGEDRLGAVWCFVYRPRE